jgi:hypothetical protein
MYVPFVHYVPFDNIYCPVVKKMRAIIVAGILGVSIISVGIGYVCKWIKKQRQLQDTCELQTLLRDTIQQGLLEEDYHADTTTTTRQHGAAVVTSTPRFKKQKSEKEYRELLHEISNIRQDRLYGLLVRLLKSLLRRMLILANEKKKLESQLLEQAEKTYRHETLMLREPSISEEYQESDASSVTTIFECFSHDDRGTENPPDSNELTREHIEAITSSGIFRLFMSHFQMTILEKQNEALKQANNTIVVPDSIKKSETNTNTMTASAMPITTTTTNTPNVIGDLSMMDYIVKSQYFKQEL